MAGNHVVKVWKLRGKGLLWGAALFSLVFFSLTASPPSPGASEAPMQEPEPVAPEMNFEWALTAPGGDISPHEGGGRSFIEGGAVPAGLDVVTHYLQQMILAGTEFSLRGPDGVPLGLTLIGHRVVQALAEEDDDDGAEIPVAIIEPSPGTPVVEEAESPAEEDVPAPAAESPGADEEEQEDEAPLPDPPEVELPEGTIAFPVDGEVITGYGWIRSATLNEWVFHPGVDIEAELGSPVRCVADGRVQEVRDDAASGVTVTVFAEDLFFVYKGMAESVVQPGDTVTKGEVLGVIGKPPPQEVGLPPHLHWEIRDRAGEPLELVVTEEGIRISH